MAGERAVTGVYFGADGSQLWDEVTAAYELSPSELELLRQACQTVDLIMVMEGELLQGSSLLVRGSTGQPRAHPLIGEIGEQRRVLETLMRSLALPMPGEVEGHRRSPAQIAAAQERWRKQREDRRGQVEGTGG